MAEFSNLYTGSGIAPQYPQDTGRSTERLSDFILEAERIKYNAFKQNEQEFLKNSQIDPAFFISKANQETQTTLLDDFNKKWSQRMRSSGYNMSTDDKMAMQAEKNLIVTKQNEMLMKQKMWEQEAALVKSNPADFDDKEHALKTAKFISDGEFDYNTLPYRAIPVSSRLLSLKGKIGKTIATTSPMEGSPGFQQTIETTGTREEVAPIIIEEVFKDPRVMKDMMQSWNALTQEEKNKYLETDNVEGISEEERKAGGAPAKSAENPILKFYIDNNYKHAISENPSTPQRITTTKAAPFSIIIGGKKVNIEPGQKREQAQNYGGLTRPNLYSFGGAAVLTDIPTDGGYNLARGMRAPLKGGSNISGQLVDYDADNKTLIFRATTGIPSQRLDPKDVFEVPIANVLDAEKLPLTIDGRQTTLGELIGGTQAPAKKKLY